MASSAVGRVDRRYCRRPRLRVVRERGLRLGDFGDEQCDGQEDECGASECLGAVCGGRSEAGSELVAEFGCDQGLGADQDDDEEDREAEKADRESDRARRG
jgi:hypothetical protein